MKFNEYDTVKVLIDINSNIKKGDIGAIVMVYDEPTEAYEVEFINEDGTQKAQLVLQANEVEKV